MLLLAVPVYVAVPVAALPWFVSFGVPHAVPDVSPEPR